MTTTESKITLAVTIHEAAWLRDALSLASQAYAKKDLPGLSAWTNRFAKGLDAKILAIHPSNK